MPKLEVEIGEDGKVGTLPEPLQKFVDGLITGRHKEIAEKAAKEARERAEKELADKYRGVDAAERERLKALEEETQRWRTADAERKAEYEKALKIREEAEAKREDERKRAEEQKDKEIQRRDSRLREMARSEIKIAAKTLGARDESLDELASILGAAIDLDADLLPFVKGDDGKPAVDEKGQPVTIEGFVKAYLDRKPHHRAPSGGTGGGARGGAFSASGLTGDALAAQQKVEVLQQRIQNGDRSDATLNDLLEATRAMNRAKAGK